MSKNRELRSFCESAGRATLVHHSVAATAEASALQELWDRYQPFNNSTITQPIAQCKNYLRPRSLDNVPARSHLPFMRRCHAILVALLFAFASCAHAQSIVYFPPNLDHDWAIHCGTQTYGLVQYTDSRYHYAAGKVAPFTFTSVCFGSRSFILNMSVWPILAALAFLFGFLAWLTVFGIGALTRTTEKPPPPDPSPPP
jgi:hypothetical protein